MPILLDSQLRLTCSFAFYISLIITTFWFVQFCHSKKSAQLLWFFCLVVYNYLQLEWHLWTNHDKKAIVISIIPNYIITIILSPRSNAIYLLIYDYLNLVCTTTNKTARQNLKDYPTILSGILHWNPPVVSLPSRENVKN